MTDWTTGEDGKYPDKNQYVFDRGRKHYFLRIGDFHNYKNTYQHASKKGNAFEFSLKIVHKPLIANFWHFEFATHSEHGEVVDTSAAWKKLICSSILDRIQEKAFFQI